VNVIGVSVTPFAVPLTVTASPADPLTRNAAFPFASVVGWVGVIEPVLAVAITAMPGIGLLLTSRTLAWTVTPPPPAETDGFGGGRKREVAGLGTPVPPITPVPVPDTVASVEVDMIVLFAPIACTWKA
jgi:hypothetical protein